MQMECKDGCMKGEVKCFWRDDLKQAKACYKCNTHKRLCTKDGVGQKGSEAGPSKKRKVVVEKVEKGKGKEKEVDIWGEILAELWGLWADMQEFWGEFQNMVQVGNHIARHMKAVARDVCDLADHFVLGNGVQREVEEEALEGTLQ
ncbi:hypothetical protein PILCRDRAFT_17228 [Piloderma croceum F 1598]|uniref:Uncharacterized protein n=1 Tax=Piloderma croceum (strain F 1598) TaxID=765440 RepID=A0A0C3ETX1_PILCF|nr:hypothetical protein PILCRDRAFT_17228 [Piloderma croceum F 1598]